MDRRAFLAVEGGAVLSGCAAAPADDREASTGRSPENRLSIRSGADDALTLSFVLTEQETGAVAYDRTLTLEPDKSLNWNDEFSAGTAYRFVVGHGGETIFARAIYPYEGYVLTIRPGPEVEITRQVEI